MRIESHFRRPKIQSETKVKQKTIAEFYQVNPNYVEEIYSLQIELLKLQKHINESKKRIVVLFEGRDAAGKGSAIARFTQFLNPQHYQTVAAGKPNKAEKGQWYFQRYLLHLPNAGKMTFFDRSWYNRAVVEPAMGFCTQQQYELFMNQVNHVEKMLVDDGITLIKFWFSIHIDEQKRRINERLNTPLIQWKVSPVDLAAQEKWQEFTDFKEKMFTRTSTEYAPWHIVSGTTREDSRIQAMKHVLSIFDYPGKIKTICKPASDKVSQFVAK